MPPVFRYVHEVSHKEIDAYGHVNNVEYVRWLQDAAIAHSAEQGWNAEKYLAADGGFVARSHFIEYLRPAFAKDQIAVITWVAGMEKVTSRRRYRVVRPADGALLAVAETDWAFLALSTRRPKRIPPELHNAFEIVDAPEFDPSEEKSQSRRTELS